MFEIRKDVLDFIKKKKHLKLSEILRGLKKVIETEGDIRVQQVIISKNEFSLVKDNNLYKVEDYDKLISLDK